jgi:hypothetical protein
MSRPQATELMKQSSIPRPRYSVIAQQLIYYL